MFGASPWQKTRALARVLLSILFTICASSLLADRVYLRSGQQLDGTIVNQNKNEITFRAESGQVQKIQKSDIVRIVYGNLTPEQKANEEKQKQEEAARLAAYQKQLAEAQRLETEKQEADRKAAAKREEEIRKSQSANEQALKTQEQSRPSENRTSQPRPQAFGCAWRSALLPGWGQVACGQTRSAIEVGVLFLGAVMYAGQQNAFQRNALREYNRQSLYGFIAFAQQGVALTGINYELVKQSKGDYHSRLRNYSQSLSILSFTYLAQVAHAFWIGRPSNQVANVSPGYSMENTSIAIRPEWRASSPLLSAASNRIDFSFTRRF